VPLVYSGQELPNTKRLKFFDKDSIEWSDGPALQGFYQTLLQARDESTALKYGDVEILCINEDNKAFAFVRKHESRVVVVLLNFSVEEKLKIKVQHESFHGTFESLFSGLHYEFSNQMEFELDPWGWLVYRK
jgi:glycosidase